MLDELDQSLRSSLPSLLTQPAKWDSLIVNRRKPHTYRVFTTLENGLRLCLHRFNPCDTHEAFRHPHPWPGAFIVLDGSYIMETWLARDREDKNPQPVAKNIMRKWSAYEITNPMTWHSVVPLETTYTIMVNGEPFPPEIAHTEVRRTGGKDLDKMPEADLLDHLSLFRQFVEQYVNRGA
jgi:hypothetical protein